MMGDDERWMRLALREAARATGLTHPNPPVGCVVVKNGTVVGRGHTQPPPGPHAEVMALTTAGSAAQGATLYVTLEPCSHIGRTQPCTTAIAQAGLARVVAAVRDPNPAASGGFEQLARSGVETTILDVEGKAEARLAPFLHWARTGMPYVVHKSAMSLDGKTASASGESRWITGPVARAYVHRLRQRLGAVMIGIGTVLTDDPLLTVRRNHSRLAVPPGPTRIVVDSTLRLPVTSRLVQTASESPVIVVCGESAEDRREAALQGAGATVLRVGEREGKPDFAILLAELGRRGITGVLLEGGGELAFSAHAAGCVREVLYFVAPMLLGGRDAHSPLDGEGFATPQESVKVAGLTVRRCGTDWLMKGFVEGRTGS